MILVGGGRGTSEKTFTPEFEFLFIVQFNLSDAWLGFYAIINSIQQNLFVCDFRTLNIITFC